MPATAAAPTTARLTVSQASLAAALSAVVPVLKNRNLPVLHMVQWTGRTITGTDLDVTLEVQLDGVDELSRDAADPQNVSAVCLPGAKWLELVKHLPAGPVTVAWDETRATITAGRDRFTLVGLLAREFPAIPAVDPSHAVRLGADVLAGGFQAVRHAISTDQANRTGRPWLTGVHVFARDGALVFEATNGHRLAQRQTTHTSPSALADIVIPVDAVDRLLSLLGEEGDALVDVASDGTAIHVQGDGWSLTARVLDGQFPETAHLIDRQRDDLRTTIDRPAWLTALARVRGFADSTHAVRLTWEDGVATFASSVEAGDASVEVPYAGPAGHDPVHTRINVDYLRDALKSLPADEARLRVKDDRRALLIEAESHVCLVMPLADRSST